MVHVPHHWRSHLARKRLDNVRAHHQRHKHYLRPLGDPRRRRRVRALADGRNGKLLARRNLEVFLPPILTSGRDKSGRVGVEYRGASVQETEVMGTGYWDRFGWEADGVGGMCDTSPGTNGSVLELLLC